MGFSAAEVAYFSTLKGNAAVTYVGQLQERERQIAQDLANRPRIRTADSLASTQYATFLDLLSEGEIEGFPSAAGLTKGTSAYNIAALKDIYLNKTPILREGVNLDNVQPTDYNFQNLSIEPRYGTQAQTYIQGYGDISEPITVGTTILQATPAVRTINDVNVNGVIITIVVPALQEFNQEGDILGASFSFTIALSYNGAAYVTVATETISGRTADSYQRDYRVDFTTGWTGSVAVKITRLTADSADPATLVNAFQWAYYQEITYQKLTYPNSAIVAIKFDSQQFSSFPSRTYRVRGVKVRVPTGVTVDQTNGRIIYPSGYTFDGTLTAENARVWTSDPAWILFDLLTSTRYGFGQHIAEAQLDKPAFYAASVYASALVSDGLNGMEPRFSCNVLIQNQDDAYKLINDLSSVMRVMPYWATGALTISQDAPRDASYLFTMANVTEQGFSYSGSSIKTRHTVAVVGYLDTRTQDVAYEMVEDAVGIAKYGINKTELRAFACTSRGQAARLGHWVLYSEANETEVVTFASSIESGVLVRPGQVIKIADPLKAGIRRAGRINSATTTQITVDNTDATDLTTAASAKLTVIMPDGSVEERNIATIVGAVITVSTAFSTTPNVGSIWMLQNTNVAATTWRVLTVTETNGAEYEITALAHNSSKYDYVEQNRPLQNPNISVTEFSPDPPNALKANEILYALNGKAASKLIVRWQPVIGASEYQIHWKYGNNNWTLANATSAEYEILEAVAAVYYIRVYSLNALRIPSTSYAELTIALNGKTAPPSTPTGISLVPSGDSLATLSWDRATDLDVILGGKVLIRHNTSLLSATWDSSQQIVSAAAGSQTQKQVPLLEGTYLIKFEDDTGHRSASAAMIKADLPEPQPRLLVQAIREDQDYYLTVDEMGTWDSLGEIDGIKSALFAGTKTNMAYDAGVDGLIVTDTSLGTGEYQFLNTLDMGGIFAVNMRRYLVTRSYLPNSLWDSQAAEIDSWTDIDGTAPDRVDGSLYVRSTTSNPAVSPVWSDWNEISNGLLRGRGFQFKLVATISNANQNIIVDELGVTIELQQRTEQLGPIETSSAGTASVSFANPFYEAPVLGFSAYVQSADDVAEIINVSRTGFDINFAYQGASIARKFTYTAVGYGKEIT
jgi:predicted phage tail protein